MGIEIAAYIAAASAVAAAGTGIYGAVQASEATGKQEELERERKAQLLSEQKAREEARRRAETQGARIGQGEAGGGRASLTTGLGLGTGDTAGGLGGGTLFGN